MTRQVPSSRSPSDYLPLKHDVLAICLALREGARHGYAIMRDAERLTDGRVVLQPGALYRTLRQLLAEALIRESAPPAGEQSDDPRRRYYQLTAFGRAVLDAELDRLEALVRIARSVRTARSPRLA